jgi:predicted Zn finger-like uncharacterized protein
MKVTCQSCQAKYTIADEKVRGKVAKIRCKKCGTTIIVNATGAAQSVPPGQPDAAAAAQSLPPAAAVDYAHHEPQGEMWSVLIADGDQRQLTPPQIDELYRQGTVGYDTYVWKDGMTDWLQISDVESLKAFLDRGSKPAIGSPAHEQPVWSPPPAEPRAAPTPSPAAAHTEAVRRPGRNASADLFGAGGGDDVMTSAPINPVLHEPEGAEKPTGARNENSVLFSLASLSGSRPDASPGGPAASDPNAPPPSRQADLNSLLRSGGNGAQKSAGRIDDIMNLGAGGIYAPGLASPALAPPPVDFPSASAGADDMTAPTAGTNNKKMFLAFGAGIVVVGAIMFGIQALGGNDKDQTSASRSATNAVTAVATAPTAPPTPAAPAAPAPAETASATPTSAAPTALAPGAVVPPATKTPGKVAAKTTTKDDNTPSSPAAAPAPTKVNAVAVPVAAAPAPAAGGGDGPAFDRAAAISALSAAASSAQSCKRADGPTGSGRIAVTFAPSGNATTANVEGPPFAGTPVGGCVAARFRGTRVPAFGGASVTVRKTFFIN